MRAACILCLIIIVSRNCSAQNDDPFFQIAKNYFRSNPYHLRFSTFLSHLLNDPTLINKTVTKRSDSSLFLFKGYYSHHSPFTFKAERTEIRLEEIEVDLNDFISRKDTVMFYQLLGYAYGAAGMEAVKKEFTKFDRRYGKNFFTQDTEIKNGDKIVGLGKNYFTVISTISPLSIAWVRLDDLQNVFTITLRMKVEGNVATLPVPPDSR